VTYSSSYRGKDAGQERQSGKTIYMSTYRQGYGDAFSRKQRIAGQLTLSLARLVPRYVLIREKEPTVTKKPQAKKVSTLFCSND
jgi:hypothetical protein